MPMPFCGLAWSSRCTTRMAISCGLDGLRALQILASSLVNGLCQLACTSRRGRSRYRQHLRLDVPSLQVSEVSSMSIKLTVTAMATCTPDTPVRAMVMMFLGSMFIGFQEIGTSVVSTLTIADQREIGAATGLASSIRSAISSVGSA